MEHGLESRPLDDRFEGSRVADVDPMEARPHSGDLFDAVERRQPGVGEIVGDLHIVTGFDQGNDRVAADEAGAAGHENMHVLNLSTVRP